MHRQLMVPLKVCVFLEDLKEGLTLISHFGCGTTQGCDTSSKELNILDVLRGLHIEEGLHLIQIFLNSNPKNLPDQTPKRHF